MKKIYAVFFLGILTGCGCPEELAECERPERCYLQPDAGLCMAAFQKYYFDPVDRKCKSFSWGGCGGVVPFETLEECESCVCATDQE